MLASPVESSIVVYLERFRVGLAFRRHLGLRGLGRQGYGASSKTTYLLRTQRPHPDEEV